MPDSVKFPDGLKVVVDKVHALGLRFGLYADRGFYTCAFRAGSRHHEHTMRNSSRVANRLPEVRLLLVTESKEKGCVGRLRADARRPR